MTAISATFSDFRIVKGRKVAQLIFETPLEAADDALSKLGGLPRPDAERWVGIAPLVGKPKAEQKPEAPAPEPEKAAHASSKPSIDAFWMCRRRDFQEWLGVTSESAADERIKEILRIQSKTQLDADGGAAIHWRDLLDRFHAATMPQERPA